MDEVKQGKAKLNKTDVDGEGKLIKIHDDWK